MEESYERRRRGQRGKSEKEVFPALPPRRVYSYQTKAEPKLNENMGIGCRHKKPTEGYFFSIDDSSNLTSNFSGERRSSDSIFFVPVAYSYGSSKKYAF